MRVYHGSLERVPTPEIRQATRTLDYGTGFYTTTSAKQAEVANIQSGGSISVPHRAGS